MNHHTLLNNSYLYFLHPHCNWLSSDLVPPLTLCASAVPLTDKIILLIMQTGSHSMLKSLQSQHDPTSKLLSTAQQDLLRSGSCPLIFHTPHLLSTRALMTYLQFPSLYALPAVPLLVYLASPPHPQVSWTYSAGLGALRPQPHFVQPPIGATVYTFSNCLLPCLFPL